MDLGVFRILVVVIVFVVRAMGVRLDDVEEIDVKLKGTISLRREIIDATVRIVEGTDLRITTTMMRRRTRGGRLCWIDTFEWKRVVDGGRCNRARSVTMRPSWCPYRSDDNGGGFLRASTYD